MTVNDDGAIHAAVLHEYGTPLCCGFAEPVASDDQVVVEVAAAGENPFDLQLSSGTFFAKPAAPPCVVGLDGVGASGHAGGVGYLVTGPWGYASGVINADWTSGREDLSAHRWQESS